jgi:hypothetical protein
MKKNGRSTKLLQKKRGTPFRRECFIRPIRKRNKPPYGSLYVAANTRLICMGFVGNLVPENKDKVAIYSR